MRLHEEFQLNLDGVVEFPMYKCNYGLLCHVYGAYYISSRIVRSFHSIILNIETERNSLIKTERDLVELTEISFCR